MGPLNLAYFNGYAMWTYHATPFVFGEPGYEARDVAPIENDGETLRGVAVRFPEGRPQPHAGTALLLRLGWAAAPTRLYG